MIKQSFIYDDGTWDIEKRIFVDIHNNYDSWVQGDWNKTDYLEIIPNKKYPMLKIPKTHIVEIDFITNEFSIEKNILLRTIIGIAIPTAIITVPLAISLAPLPLIGKCISVFKSFIFTGAGVGALTSIGIKTKIENHCIITFFNETNPNDLQMLIFDANTSIGNTFVNDRKTFIDTLRKQVFQTSKAQCVKDFKNALNQTINDNDFNENMVFDIPEDQLEQCTTFNAHLKMYESDKTLLGSKAIRDGELYTFSFNNDESEGIITLHDNPILYMGKEDYITVKLNSPVNTHLNAEFYVSDGKKGKGIGKITKLIE